MLWVNSLLPLGSAEEMDKDALAGLDVVVELLEDCKVMMFNKL